MKSSKNSCRGKSIDSEASIDDACAALRQAITSVGSADAFPIPLNAPYINFIDDALMLSYVNKQDIEDLLNREWATTPMMHVYIE